MGGESCSLGGDECSMDLMVVQRRLGFFEASFMRSRLAAANDEVISLFADEHYSYFLHYGLIHLCLIMMK